jgi:hypothetical protein
MTDIQLVATGTLASGCDSSSGILLPFALLFIITMGGFLSNQREAIAV